MQELKGICELAEYSLKAQDHEMMLYAELRRVEVCDQFLILN